MTEQDVDRSERWPAPSMLVGRERSLARRTRAGTPRAGKLSRRPASGLAAVVLFGLIAIVIAGVSAEPLWLALGHGVRGTATVTGCTGSGLAERCRAQFAVPGQADPALPVTLIGASVAQRRAGARLRAEVIVEGRPRAYVGGAGSLALRFLLGLVLLLLVGLVIAWISGAYRLPDRRSRRYALLASLAGPVLLLLGALFVTW